LSLLTAYDYLYQGQNEFSEPVIVHIGLQAVDITRLSDFEPADPIAGSLDPFVDLVVDLLEMPKLRGRQKKQREAGNGKGPIKKFSKPQVCKVCNEPGHNRATCTRLIRLEGDTPGLGVL
jgi:hypothetical protein